MIDVLPQQQKALPHSEESERAVLGGVLLDPSVLPTISGRLRAEDFYSERHQILYQAMLDLQEEQVEIDLRTLQARLEQRGQLERIGGLAYLTGLDLDLPDIGRIDAYVEIVKERSVRRRLIQISGQIIRNCLDGGLEAREALGRAEQAILGLGEEAIQRGFAQLSHVLHTTLEELEERPGTMLTGVPTGFTDFDRISQGLNRGNLIIIAGRPGMGKTSFALNVAQHVTIRERKTVGVFSLEMSQQELALRILCSEADISFSRLRSNRVSQKEWTRIIQTVRAIGDAPLYIDDSPNPTLLEIASKSRRLKAERGLSLIVLDYLQLMQAGGRYENRNLEIAAISRGMKQLAKELEIPVIALSQLSRQPERRGSDHRPQLADLRESGIDRAGRRHGGLHLPRRGLQPDRGEQGAGRADHRQAPQRRDRHRRPRLPRRDHQLPQPRPAWHRILPLPSEVPPARRGRAGSCEDLQAALRPAWVDVDLAALERNLAAIRRAARRAVREPQIMAVVKADAYGHGAVGVSPRPRGAGVDWLGVALLEEGAEIRRAGVRLPILVLGTARPEKIALYAPLPAHPDPLVARRAGPLAGLDGGAARAAAGPSQGGHRHGPPRRGARRGAAGAGDPARRPGLRLAGLLSHFGDADDLASPRNPAQEERFAAVLALLDSGGARGHPDPHGQQRRRPPPPGEPLRPGADRDRDLRPRSRAVDDGSDRRAVSSR